MSEIVFSLFLVSVASLFGAALGHWPIPSCKPTSLHQIESRAIFHEAKFPLPAIPFRLKAACWRSVWASRRTSWRARRKTPRRRTSASTSSRGYWAAWRRRAPPWGRPSASGRRNSSSYGASERRAPKETRGWYFFAGGPEHLHKRSRGLPAWNRDFWMTIISLWVLGTYSGVAQGSFVGVERRPCFEVSTLKGSRNFWGWVRRLIWCKGNLCCNCRKQICSKSKNHPCRLTHLQFRVWRCSGQSSWRRRLPFSRRRSTIWTTCWNASRGKSDTWSNRWDEAHVATHRLYSRQGLIASFVRFQLQNSRMVIQERDRLIKELEEKVALLEAEVRRRPLFFCSEKKKQKMWCEMMKLNSPFCQVRRYAQRLNGTIVRFEEAGFKLISLFDLVRVQNREMRDQMDHFLGGQKSSSYLSSEQNPKIVYR